VSAAGAVALEVLRDSGEPVREAALYERVTARGVEVAPPAFVAVLERLATEGHVRVSFEHDSTVRDPEPFEPRFWSLVS
jgi:hypothetical protein